MPLRVLVTGGAGFIGQQLVRRLEADGHEVVVLDSFLPQVHGNVRPSLRCKTIWADIRDLDTLRGAMRDVNVVHHLAAETGVGQSQYEIARYVSVNTHGTSLVLQAACEADVRQVVIASSRAVYGEGRYRCPSCETLLPQMPRKPDDMAAGLYDILCPRCGTRAAVEPTPEDADLAPTSIYGITKLQQEQLASTVATSHGLEVTLLRLFNVFGPGQSLRNPYVGVLGTFVRRMRDGQPVELYEDGQMVRDFVFVSDVAEIFRNCTGNENAFGRTWNVGTGTPVTLHQLAQELGAAIGTEPRVEVSGRFRLGDVRHAVADVARLRQGLGEVPGTSLRQGLKEFVTWALENPDSAPDDLAEQQLASRNLLRQTR
ncbi:MAG: NAD-dependent epimerase/dehydratase family protein [Acidimicrobiales bacterium]